MEKRKNALLVVDVQFGPMWNTYRKEETMSLISNLIEAAKRNSVPVIYTQHEEPEGGLLTRGSQFWQFQQGISSQEDDLVIHKSATDAFYQTSLKQELKMLGATHLIVVGARTEYCIDTTCRAAVSLGFDVTLVEDGHTTTDAAIPANLIIEHHNLTLKNTGNPQRKINIIPAEQIVF